MAPKYEQPQIGIFPEHSCLQQLSFRNRGSRPTIGWDATLITCWHTGGLCMTNVVLQQRFSTLAPFHAICDDESPSYMSTEGSSQCKSAYRAWVTTETLKGHLRTTFDTLLSV